MHTIRFSGHSFAEKNPAKLAPGNSANDNHADAIRAKVLERHKLRSQRLPGQPSEARLYLSQFYVNRKDDAPHADVLSSSTHQGKSSEEGMPETPVSPHTSPILQLERPKAAKSDCLHFAAEPSRQSGKLASSEPKFLKLTPEHEPALVAAHAQIRKLQQQVQELKQKLDSIQIKDKPNLLQRVFQAFFPASK